MKAPLLALCLPALLGMACGTLRVYGSFYLPDDATATAIRAAETSPAEVPSTPIRATETSPATAAPTATSTPALVATPFTGIWQGVDPLDGSLTTLSLVQEGTLLRGTFEDAFSPSVDPPGFQGSGAGPVRSATTAEMTFDLFRWDGVTVTVTYFLTLWDGDSMALDCSICPVSQQLHRQ